MPWHIPEDLARFKKLTSGHPIVIGSRTFESIGKLLPNRENIILSKSRTVNGATNYDSPEPVLKRSEKEDIYVCGGESVYEFFLPYVQVLELTLIDAFIEGNTFFPKIAQKEWKVIKKIKGKNNFKGHNYHFFTLKKLNIQKHFDKKTL